MMKLPTPQPDWPVSWCVSYANDKLELTSAVPRAQRGYAYSYRRRREVTLDLVQEIAQPGAAILDVGAAQGNFTLSLAERGYRVTWNDLRAELADYVRLKCVFGDVRYRPGEIHQLPPSEEYDVVLATEIIEHVAHPDKFLKKIAAFAKPDGFVVLTTPNGAYFRNRLPRFSACTDPSKFEASQFAPDADGHIFLLHPHEFESLADDAQLELIELRLFSTFLTHGWLGTRRLVSHLPEAPVRVVDWLAGRSPWVFRKKVATDLAAVMRRNG
jgi:2-polyprenyl-3-methyl-5-hydroxy-6-metoxy-1,4-benzoquinol methylase